MDQSVYTLYSKVLQKKYGGKVYKLPVSLPVSCPNREFGVGCSFCGDKGAGFENLSSTFSVNEQLQRNMEYIGKRYKADKFIAYFQSFTNTYLPLEIFKKALYDAVLPNIVEIAISTRPDCIHQEYLNILDDFQRITGITVTLELGLQSVNFKTLKKVHRGHTLAEFVDAMYQIRPYKFNVTAHMILNLPWDDLEDCIEGAKILSALRVDSVKLHALYIEKETEIARQYENGEFELCDLEEYKNRVITFLRYLAPDISVQRIIGRAPKENTIFANWGQSWWKIHDDIVNCMQEKGFYQGDLCNYLNGKCVGKFLINN